MDQTRMVFAPDRMGEVVECSITQARPMVERWHYSGKMPGGFSRCFEWVSDRHPFGPYAVAAYGIGTNPYQASYLARVTGLGVTDATM